jgi:transcriptional regulator with XRE-family HTH domain
MDARRRFGETLRRLRTAAGVSQERLGFRAGLHRTEISLLERGQRDPRLTTVIRLADALGVDPAALLADVAQR